MVQKKSRWQFSMYAYTYVHKISGFASCTSETKLLLIVKLRRKFAMMRGGVKIRHQVMCDARYISE